MLSKKKRCVWAPRRSPGIWNLYLVWDFELFAQVLFRLMNEIFGPLPQPKKALLPICNLLRRLDFSRGWPIERQYTLSLFLHVLLYAYSSM